MPLMHSAWEKSPWTLTSLSMQQHTSKPLQDEAFQKDSKRIFNLVTYVAKEFCWTRIIYPQTWILLNKDHLPPNMNSVEQGSFSPKHVFCWTRIIYPQTWILLNKDHLPPNMNSVEQGSFTPKHAIHLTLKTVQSKTRLWNQNKHDDLDNKETWQSLLVKNWVTKTWVTLTRLLAKPVFFLFGVLRTLLPSCTQHDTQHATSERDNNNMNQEFETTVWINW